AVRAGDGGRHAAGARRTHPRGARANARCPAPGQGNPAGTAGSGHQHVRTGAAAGGRAARRRQRGVNDVLLGVIAIAVLTMAIVQVAAIVFALRAARRVGEAVDRLERRVEPIVANLQALTADASRATTLAAAQ